MEVQVIDNFLGDYQFKSLQNILMGNNFPWYFYDGIVNYNEGHCQFTYGFLRDHYEPDINFPLVEPCLKKLGCKKLYRIKANLVPKTFFHKRTTYHSDLSDPPPQTKTAIFYMNTCNGWTRFKKGGKVKSVANRMVIFDHELLHSGVTCTDKRRRVVINFNYK